VNIPVDSYIQNVDRPSAPPMTDRDTDGLLAQLRPVLVQVPHLDRRLGRALAFLVLYEADLAHHPPTQILERLSGITMSEATTAPYSAESVAAATEYASELRHGHSHRCRQLIVTCYGSGSMNPDTAMLKSLSRRRSTKR
jgi:hypothetical protein